MPHFPNTALGTTAEPHCEKWLKTLAHLQVDRFRGPAPHKPLLLLVLAGLAEQRLLTAPTIPLTGELVFRFLAFWTAVSARRTQRPDIRLPFYHLSSDGFWTPLDELGNATSERIRVVAIRLGPEFLACLSDSAFLVRMRRVLIATYFADPGERAALYNLVGMPVPPDDEVKSDARLYKSDRERGREARFRLIVVPAYNYTCALTRLPADDSEFREHSRRRSYP